MARHDLGGFDDDLAPCKSAVALRPTDDEAAGRVDVDLGLMGDQLGGQDRLDNVFADRFLDRFELHFIVVLCRNDDRFDARDFTIVVAHRHLRLAIGAEPVDAFDLFLPNFGEPVCQLVRQLNRQRHKLIGFVAGVSEHQALVAGALLGRIASIDSLRNVWGLLFYRRHDSARGSVKAVLGACKADVAHG